MEKVEITIDEYNELKEKAKKYDKIVSSGSKGGVAGQAKFTAKERSARAKKAVEARIKKYKQKTRD